MGGRGFLYMGPLYTLMDATTLGGGNQACGVRGCLHLGGRSVFFVHVPPGATLPPRLRVRGAHERLWRGKAQTAGIAR